MLGMQISPGGGGMTHAGGGCTSNLPHRPPSLGFGVTDPHPWEGSFPPTPRGGSSCPGRRGPQGRCCSQGRILHHCCGPSQGCPPPCPPSPMGATTSSPSHVVLAAPSPHLKNPPLPAGPDPARAPGDGDFTLGPAQRSPHPAPGHRHCTAMGTPPSPRARMPSQPWVLGDTRTSVCPANPPNQPHTPKTRCPPTQGTLPHHPGLGKGSESGRAQSGTGTQCHGPPRAGSTHTRARWGC